jgi:hypothetical protein
MGKKAKLGIVCAAAATAAVGIFFAIRQEDRVYEITMNAELCLKNRIVLSLKTGQLISREDALSMKAPFLSLHGAWTTEIPRNVWHIPLPSKQLHSAFLDAGYVDLEFAPTDKQGKLLRNYWKDSDDTNWPKSPWRKTSSYQLDITHNFNIDKFSHPILFRTYDGTAGVLKLVKTKNDKDVLVRYKIIGSAKPNLAEERVTDAAEQFVATLPNGVKVEMVGISRCPSAGTAWWKPDGDELERAPYINVSQPFSTGENGLAYEIAYRLCDPSRTIGWASIMRVAGSTARTGFRGKDEFGREAHYISAGAVLFDDELPSTTVDFGVALGQWQRVLATRGEEQSREYDSKSVRISAAVERDGGIVVDLTLPFDWIDQYSMRLVAVGRTTRVRIHQLTVKDIVETDPGSLWRRFAVVIDNLRLAVIKEFRFELCPYQWVSFKNVSLEPGENPGFEIEVDERQSQSSK